MHSIFLIKINGDKANSFKWRNIISFCKDVIRSGIVFWEFKDINSFPFFNWSFFQLHFCAVFHLITLGLLSFSYKQVLLVLLATAEREAEPECLPRFSLLTPLKASSFPQGAWKELSLGSLQWGAVCHSSTERNQAQWSPTVNYQSRF